MDGDFANRTEKEIVEIQSRIVVEYSALGQTITARFDIPEKCFEVFKEIMGISMIDFFIQPA